VDVVFLGGYSVARFFFDWYSVFDTAIAKIIAFFIQQLSLEACSAVPAQLTR
jgi:hypothetical protein